MRSLPVPLFYVHDWSTPIGKIQGYQFECEHIERVQSSAVPSKVQKNLSAPLVWSACIPLTKPVNKGVTLGRSHLVTLDCSEE